MTSTAVVRNPLFRSISLAMIAAGVVCPSVWAVSVNNALDAQRADRSGYYSQESLQKRINNQNQVIEQQIRLNRLREKTALDNRQEPSSLELWQQKLSRARSRFQLGQKLSKLASSITKPDFLPAGERHYLSFKEGIYKDGKLQRYVTIRYDTADPNQIVKVVETPVKDYYYKFPGDTFSHQETPIAVTLGKTGLQMFAQLLDKAADELAISERTPPSARKSLSFSINKVDPNGGFFQLFSLELTRTGRLSTERTEYSVDAAGETVQTSFTTGPKKIY